MNDNLVKIINSGMKLLMIALLAYVIIKQGQIIKVIYEEKDKLDADPLAYGAKVYGIDSCTCIVNENITIEFNQYNSKFIKHIRGSPMSDFNSLNWTNIINVTS